MSLCRFVRAGAWGFTVGDELARWEGERRLVRECAHLQDECGWNFDHVTHHIFRAAAGAWCRGVGVRTNDRRSPTQDEHWGEGGKTSTALHNLD